ncbi:MAG: carbohydrate ABC transporter permease [Herbinix sp.]|nr:carbohydrate ABC transporter permease [Herbinix sp.]
MSIGTKVKKLIIHILMLFYMIIILSPLMWMLISGFKADSDIFSTPWGLPTEWKVQNFIYVWTAYIQKNVLNSLFFTIIGTFFVVLISGFAAYAVVRFKFKFKYLVFLFILSGMMLAPQCSLIPIYKMLSITGLYNTRVGLLIPYIAYRIPFSFFLMWSFMVTLPVEVEEAAIIDGSTIFQTFFKIVMKMSKPSIATTAVLSARYIWNDFAFALVFTEGKDLQTVPLGIFAIRSTSQTQWGVLIAGLTLAALPMIIVYIALQRYFVEGMNSGAVKG